MELLELKRVRIQGLIARGVVLKYTPRLRFVLDESVERGNRVLKILEELEASGPLNEPEQDLD
jgi:ribosome-binding factor A